METVISKMAEQSLTVGVMMVMYYYQRLDKENFIKLFLENSKLLQEVKYAIEKQTEELRRRP